MKLNTDLISLSELAVGSSCRIRSIELVGLLRRRILDLGILPGTVVECVRRSPAGDPTAYTVRGAIIALRRDDARQIKVAII
jgi:ferrous iron transport protein A